MSDFFVDSTCIDCWVNSTFSDIGCTKRKRLRGILSRHPFLPAQQGKPQSPANHTRVHAEFSGVFMRSGGQSGAGVVCRNLWQRHVFKDEGHRKIHGLTAKKDQLHGRPSGR